MSERRSVWLWTAALLALAVPAALAAGKPWFPPIQGTLWQSADSVLPLQQVTFEATAVDRDQGQTAGGALMSARRAAETGVLPRRS